MAVQFRDGMRVRITDHQGFADMNGITGTVVRRLISTPHAAWIRADADLPAGRNCFPLDDPHGRGRYTKVYDDECEALDD